MRMDPPPRREWGQTSPWGLIGDPKSPDLPLRGSEPSVSLVCRSPSTDLSPGAWRHEMRWSALGHTTCHTELGSCSDLRPLALLGQTFWWRGAGRVRETLELGLAAVGSEEPQTASETLGPDRWPGEDCTRVQRELLGETRGWSTGWGWQAQSLGFVGRVSGVTGLGRDLGQCGLTPRGCGRSGPISQGLVHAPPPGP